jgi:acetyl esterase/lipase
MQPIHIWNGFDKPYHKDSDVQEYEAEQWGGTCVFNVIEPTLTVYPPHGQDTGVGVVVLAGGGYTTEAIQHEGHDVALALSQHGITAAVLKYRLPNPKTSDTPHLVSLADVRQSVKLLREQRAGNGSGLRRVGLVGFSAGSHLATVACVRPSRVEKENPDFAGLIYGTTNLSDENLKWLEDSLYFRKLTEAEIASERLLDWVTQYTPPAFLMHSYDDDICYVQESTLYAQKLFAHGVPVEMHLFAQGGHGFGLGRAEDGTNQWLGLFVNWLKRL